MDFQIHADTLIISGIELDSINSSYDITGATNVGNLSQIGNVRGLLAVKIDKIISET